MRRVYQDDPIPSFPSEGKGLDPLSCQERVRVRSMRYIYRKLLTCVTDFFIAELM
jgi:hypothetical protein